MLPRRDDDDDFVYLDNPEAPLTLEYSQKCFPSVIYFSDEGIQIANSKAVDALSNKDKASTVVAGFKVEDRDKALIKYEGKGYSVKDLESLLLGKIWSSLIEKNSQFDFQEAIITVPAGYTSDQNDEVKTAAEIAGINKVHLINEPTAAYKFYEHQQPLTEMGIKNVLVFDFGGGTTDVTIMDVSKEISTGEGSYTKIDYEVLGQGSELKCGGKNVDEALYKLAVESVFDGHEPENANLRKRMLQELERKKIELTEKYQELRDEEM